MNDHYNNIAGSLIGGAIGDALGYQIEFQRNIKEKQVTRFNGIGKISDDTQMTLFTANALLWGQTNQNMKGIEINPTDAIYLGYLDWLDTQNGLDNNKSISWIKEIPELNSNRAPGNTCLSALSSGIKGTISKPINNSKGCGSTMRVAPIGLYIKDNSKVAGQIAAEASAITHGHPLGIIPSYILAAMINLIVYKNMNIKDALNEALKQLKETKQFKEEDIQIMSLLINKAIRLSITNIKDIEAIKELGEGWVAEEALAIAVYAVLKYSNNFEDAIVCAINHDGDSDSTGSIAGNIIGAFLGIQNIPSYYIENLELKDVIIELAKDLSVEIPVSEHSYTNDEYWLSKYLHCHKDII